MSKSRTFGTAVTIGGSAVGGLKSMNIGGIDVNFIDTTAWDTPDNTRTFMGGLIDNGNLQLGGLADPADVGQSALIDGPADEVAVVVTPPSGDTISFQAIIGGYNTDGSDEDGNLRFTCDLKVTGPITRTPAV